jgi:hypothetical protein
MGKVSVSNLKPGMTLDSDVLDITGRLLLGSGTGIDEKHIRIFKTWGIVEVDVRGAEDSNTEKFDDLHADIMIVNQAKKDLLQIFRHTDLVSPVIRELFRIALDNRVRTMVEESCKVHGH